MKHRSKINKKSTPNLKQLIKHQSKIDHKSIKNQSKIDQKSSKNRLQEELIEKHLTKAPK